MALFGHWLAIQCYKHDGSLHRCWDRGLVLANNDDYIVIATKKAKVIESNGRRWFTKEPAVTIFSKNEWWNVICMFKGDNLCYYCNIASPSIVETHTIKYIDYDLDVKLFPDGELKILDENEYKRHREKYNYSDDLDEVLRYSMRDIVSKMENHEFPFDEYRIRKYYDKFLKLMKKK